MRAKGCEINAADQCEDIGFRVTYDPCGRKAKWTADDERHGTLYMCEEHAREYLRRGPEGAELLEVQ